MTSAQSVRLKKAVDEALGPRYLRTTDRPDSENKGGTYFERQCWESLPNAPRAFTIGPTTQPHKRMVAPARSIKTTGELNEGDIMRKELCMVSMFIPSLLFTRLLSVKAATAVGMASFEEGPEQYKNMIRQQASLINAPRIGVKENFAFPVMQVNWAGGRKFGDGMFTSFCYPVLGNNLTHLL